MADYNDAVPDLENLVLTDKVCLDPTTILTQPILALPQSVTTLTVANGDTVLVYDVSNPSSPVLIGTIG
jgi:hypothetical protein